jgi:hypothetical protein
MKKTQQPTVTETIREQLSGLRRVTFVEMDDVTLKVSRGSKGVLVMYNRKTDLYDLRPYKGSSLADTWIYDVPSSNLEQMVREYL